MSDIARTPFEVAKHIGQLEGRLAFTEAMNQNLRGQVLALQRERRELKRKLRSKRK